jgi:mono/diheme cytochrome c family protein
MKHIGIGSFLLLSGVLIYPGIGRAQNVYEGEHVARQWCSGCHQVADEPRLHGDNVPSFPAIAKMNSTTAMSLTVFLESSHKNMPDFSLTRKEIRDVSAYILSLHKPR